MRATIYGDTDSIYVKSEKDLTKILNDHVIPAYYKKHNIKTDINIVLEDEYGIIDMILLPDIKKTYMFYIREKNKMVGKSIDKRSFVKVSVDLYKYITEKIFEGEITRWSQIDEIEKKIFDAFKFTKDFLMMYSINKDISEYKTKQPWMEGIERFKKAMPDYKGYINSGYLINLYGRPLYGKSGRRLKYDEKIVVAVPQDMMDRVDKILHKVQMDYGYKLRKNDDYYKDALFKRIKIFKKILED